MSAMLVAILLYPITDTVSLADAVWTALGFVGLVLALRKWSRARTHDRRRRAAGVNGDRRLISRMNLRTATMALVLACSMLVAGITASIVPTRPDQHADTSTLITAALIFLEAWFVRWLVHDWRDAGVLTARIDAALALVDHEHRAEGEAPS